MTSSSSNRTIVILTGGLFGLAGGALAGGGLWLALHGGSVYYLIGGLGILIPAHFSRPGRRSALWVYAAVLNGTLVWAVSEVGFDWWPLAARGDVIFP